MFAALTTAEFISLLIKTGLSGAALALSFVTWRRTEEHDRTIHGNPRTSDEGLFGRVKKNTQFRRAEQGVATDGGQEIRTDGGRPEVPDLSALSPDAETEAESGRDGALSYAGEFHALAVGALAGAAYALTGDPQTVAGVALVALGLKEATSGHLADARREVAYTAGGLLVGFLVGLMAQVVS